MLKPP
jgi:hypothetical protein